ncbi:retropepsin-like aspartic protease [Chitinophaga agri]|uniref:Aspartyl protease n=1 Tax=Chitinophaga agri TaxID=2703787 RepID=A0A6B9Z9U3_9BACT|nr:retropepsin-like aspartic protease [Chitinophaga agri]QHS59072.1 hypothetical protein GWR21_05520 [Chitinophaga agri]
MKHNRLFSSLVLLLCLSHLAHAQRVLRVIKANTDKASIIDEPYPKLDWYLDPAVRPDIYYMNVPGKPGTVTVKTDLDSFTVDTKPGRSYDLVVLLNGKDSCFIRIAALRDTLRQVRGIGKNPARDTIPFTLHGSRIYLKGFLNNKPVNIQFDLGAGASAVNRQSAEKLGIQFDGNTMVTNTQGTNKTLTSSNNTLRIADIKWGPVKLVQVGNMQPQEDLIIGNSLFMDKIVEIDYDRSLLIIHKGLPNYSRYYSVMPVWFEQDRPRFQAVTEVGGKRYSFWFLFDTGRDATMALGSDFTAYEGLWDKLDSLTTVNGRKIVRLNAEIAGVKFPDIVTNAQDPNMPGSSRPTLIGNQVLSHFNVILDNRQGFIYLKLNSRSDEPYSDYKGYQESMKAK